MITLAYKTLEKLRQAYQFRHDALGLGGKAEMRDAGNGYIGFYNPTLAVWDWYAFDNRKGGYVCTGSTHFV
jgi:hypothetical protein